VSDYPSWACQSCGAAIGHLGRFFQRIGMSPHRCKPKRQLRSRTWTLYAADPTTHRAMVFAELALMDFANDRFGLTERAALRIAEVMDKYHALDMQAAGVVNPEPPPHPRSPQ